MMKIRTVSVILLLSLVCTLLVMAQAPPQQPGAPPQQPGAPPQQPAAQQPAAQQPAAQQPAAAAPPAQVSAADLSLQNAALGEVVDRLARQLHMVLVLPPAPGLQGSVSINSYGETKSLDARNLLEMILRINGYALVQEGDVYRVVKMLDAMHQPIPIQISGKEVPEDDQIMLDLVFLKYITVDELEKVLREFIGDNAKVLTYAPANLLFILDNRRNIHRIEGLIRQFDSDMFTNQRVRLFELENARPSDVQKDLDNVLKAISLDSKTSTVHFLAVDRINILIAVAPNPGVFDTVEEWIRKFDIPATVASGAVDTYVYTVRYGRNDCLAQALNQLFNPGAGFAIPGGLGGYGAAAPAGAYGNYGYGAGGSGAYTGAYGGGAYGGIGGMGGAYGGGGGSTYGNTNSFSPAFGGSGGCGGAAGMGGATGGAMGGAYGSPAFGGYTAQTPLMGTAAGAAGQAAGAAAAAAAAGLPPPAPPPRIVPLSFDNKLMIQADPQRYQSILKMLEQLDKAPRQILLDAKIYSIDLTDQFASGVAAYFQSNTAGTPSGISGLAPYAALTGGTVTLTAGMMVSASRQLLGALSLNENISHVHILSEPSLIATDSIPATINVGTQVPVLTSQVGTPLQLGGTNAFTQNISGVSTGITLNVNARVNPSGVVTLIVDQENSSPSGGGSGSSSSSSSQNLTPSFSQQVVQTQITMQDGDTIAVGGLIGETTTSSVNGIPLLSRLPYIGGLFGSKSYTHERTELILFMTPHVIYDTTDLLEASDELVLKVKKLQKYIKDRN
jgi:general secretion pathway protein D